MNAACVVWPAGIAVRLQPASRACAKSGSISAESCTRHTGTSTPSHAIRSKRSRSSNVRPGALALNFGMLGCDLQCGYCQNWVSSQALPDARSPIDFTRIQPRQLVATALLHGAEAVVSTYNEPLITAEWAISVFREARQAGLLTGFASIVSWEAASVRSSNPFSRFMTWAFGSRSLL